MRRMALAVLGALACVSQAAAQTTTTVPSSTTSTLVSSSTTSTTIPATTSTTTTSSTSTSSTITFADYDPRACRNTAASKEDCRQTCCTDDFEALLLQCDGAACGTDWDDFVDEWTRAGDFFKFCQNPDDPQFEAEFDVSAIKKKFAEFNADDSCQAYLFGCKRAARKHVRQCADAGRCVGCCRTTLRRWRAQAARRVQRGSIGPACRRAVRCLKKADRKSDRCRKACRRAPTCGAAGVKACLEKTQGGRTVLACYGKCADKCADPDAYRWCIQACQGLDECASFDTCQGVVPTTTTTVVVATSTTSLVSSTTMPGGTSTTTTTPGGTSTTTSTTVAAAAASRGSGECLEKEVSQCVAITTTSTSTSSTTSSTSRSTTSTSSSTSTTSPLPAIVSGGVRVR